MSSSDSKKYVAERIVPTLSTSVVAERAVRRSHPHDRLLADFQSISSDSAYKPIEHAFTASFIHYTTNTFTHLHQMHQHRKCDRVVGRRGRAKLKVRFGHSPTAKQWTTSSDTIGNDGARVNLTEKQKG